MLFLAMLKLMWFFTMSLFAEGEGDGGDGGEGEGEGSSDDDEGDDDEEEDDDDDIRDPKAKLSAEQEKNNRLTKRLKQQEKEAKATADRLKALEDAGKSDDEKKVARLAELEEYAKTSQSQIATLTAVNTLLTHVDIVTLPPERRRLAIKLLEDQIEFDDEGGSNVDEKVAELKESDPVIFAAQKDDDADDDADADTSRKRPSGKPVGGKKRKDKGAQDDTELYRRFPALKR